MDFTELLDMQDDGSSEPTREAEVGERGTIYNGTVAYISPRLC